MRWATPLGNRMRRGRKRGESLGESMKGKQSQGQALEARQPASCEVCGRAVRFAAVLGSGLEWAAAAGGAGVQPQSRHSPPRNTPWPAGAMGVCLAGGDPPQLFRRSTETPQARTLTKNNCWWKKSWTNHSYYPVWTQIFPLSSLSHTFGTSSDRRGKIKGNWQEINRMILTDT